MNKKTIFTRILLFCLLYCLLFILVMIIQYSGNRTSQNETPDEVIFNPKKYIISQAQNNRDYIVALSRWQDGNFIVWNRQIQQQNDEDLVIAFAEESLNRSVYNTAVTAVNRTFLSGNKRTYGSSVFLGSLDQAYKSLIALDQEKLNRINAYIKEKSPDFLLEPNVFEFLYSRGHGNTANEALNLIKTIIPETVTLRLIPGILEGYIYHLKADSSEDYFGVLAGTAIDKIPEFLRINSDKNKVFTAEDDRIDTILNVRLGRILLDLAVYANDENWEGIARSIILSVLGLESYTGSIKAEYQISADGEISDDPASMAINTGTFYRMLDLGEYQPHAQVLASVPNHIWTWTAGGNVSASVSGNTMDISVSFPAGQTHYMIIRGVRPLAKIQLYGTDFRSDPQFERYDSSGWTYIAAEQTLLVKMKHKSAEEHIKIFF